jgi:hypothetical protein
MLRRLLLPCFVLLLAGCSATYVPTGSAPASGPSYEAQLERCRDQAHQQIDAERTLLAAAAGVLVGAAHGALAGALSGAAGEGAWIGAAAGLVVGAAIGAVSEDQDYARAVDACMSANGYRRS